MNQSYISENAWKIVEKGFNPDRVKASESIFSIGNGAMGQRANFEEHYSVRITIKLPNSDYNHRSKIKLKKTDKIGYSPPEKLVPAMVLTQYRHFKRNGELNRDFAAR